MKRTSRGFTLIEIMVVIVVIGMLAALSIMLFGNWRERNARDVLKSDLKHFSAAMENYRNVNNGYPTTMEKIKGLYNSKDSSLSEFQVSNLDNYCVEAKPVGFDSITMYIRPNMTDAKEGNCYDVPASPGP